MSFDVVLTVPHGNPNEDRAALAVAEALSGRLVKAGYDTALIATRFSRKKVDGNRPESRGRPFRRAIDEELARHGGTKLFIDCHSFKPTSRRFRDKDLVLLHTPGLQSLDWLHEYADLLDVSARELGHRLVIRVEAAQRPDDVCFQAREAGVSSQSLMLVEHNDQDDSRKAARLYAPVHFGAIERLFQHHKRRTR